MLPLSDRLARWAIPGWARAQVEAIYTDQLRRHQAALDADLVYRTGVANKIVETLCSSSSQGE